MPPRDLFGQVDDRPKPQTTERAPVPTSEWPGAPAFGAALEQVYREMGNFRSDTESRRLASAERLHPAVRVALRQLARPRLFIKMRSRR